jgi:hypothetical protein
MVPNGVEVSDATIAGQTLSFTPILPETLGEPISVQVTAQAAAPVESRAFGAMFQDARGLFWVLQQPAEVAQQDLLALLQCEEDAGCEGTRDRLDLGAGVIGVVIGGPDVTSVRWIYDGVQFDILGPADTLSITGVTDLAMEVQGKA